MLTELAEGVLAHQSGFLQSNSVVVQGRDGVLLVDPGIESDELVCLAKDLREWGPSVVAGFSTHPHWDHLLWHAELGVAPRYGTARCAETARQRLSDSGAKARVVGMLPPEIAETVPLDLIGDITGLAENATEVPWDGPRIRIIEHNAHAPGHVALLVEERGVLIVGDLLSDVLVPILDHSAADPIDDYLSALQLIEGVADQVTVVVPGHGSIGGGEQLRARINLDRAYVLALSEGGAVSDPRIGSSAKPGWEWVSDLHEGQLARFGAPPGGS